jgi:hypothetical protein
MVGESLATLTAAIAALEAVDPGALADGELHELTVGVQRLRDRLGVCAGGLVEAWDRRRVWASNQSLSAAQRLANETVSSSRTCRREVRRARKLGSMPHTTAALRDGKLSLDVVDVLGRANSGRRRALFAEHESELVRSLFGLRYPDAVRVIEYWIAHADALLGEPDPPQDAPTVYLSQVGDRWALDGDLDAIGGSIVDDELSRLTRQLRLADQEAGIERTSAQRRAAALVAMAQRSASAKGAGAKRRPLFTVHVGEGTLATLCELANGTVIRPAQLAPWLDTALLEVVLFDGPATVVSVSHRRTFTGALRRAIQVRDRRCRHPSGCDVPADACDVDHVVPAAAGGPTSQFNGRVECSTHNRHADRHDQGAHPLPMRRVDHLEMRRCQIRWMLLHEPPEDTS